MRAARIHRAGKLYYFVHRGRSAQALFLDAIDLESYRSTLATATTSCGAELLAYSMSSSEAHVAVRVGERPVSRVMSTVARAYVRFSHRRRGGTGALFSHHPNALIVDDSYLAHLIGYIHWKPILSGVANDLESWPHSSHFDYLGIADKPGIDVEAVGDLWEGGGYPQYIASTPSAAWLRAFARGLPHEPRVLGSAAFLRRLGLDVGPATTPSLQEAACSVCLYCGISHEELMAGREASGARALFAWYVDKRKIATMTRAAGYLGRHWSSISAAIERHQNANPEFFNMDAIRAAGPLVSTARHPTRELRAAARSGRLRERI